MNNDLNRLRPIFFLVIYFSSQYLLYFNKKYWITWFLVIEEINEISGPSSLHIKEAWNLARNYFHYSMESLTVISWTCYVSSIFLLWLKKAMDLIRELSLPIKNGISKCMQTIKFPSQSKENFALKYTIPFLDIFVFLFICDLDWYHNKMFFLEPMFRACL